MLSISGTSTTAIFGENQEKQIANGAQQAQLQWTEKYRPKTLDEVVGHFYPVQMIRSLIASNQFMHLLLEGSAGVGKTSSAEAIAYELFGKDWKRFTLELNASDERGIGMVQDTLKRFVSCQQMFHHQTSDKLHNSKPTASFKLVILDEADSITAIAQGALRRIMEDYVPNVYFIFTCNNVGKIITPIQSRCMRIHLSKLDQGEMKLRLREIILKEYPADANDESIDSVLETLLQGCPYDMRRCINTLEQCHLSQEPLSSQLVRQCLGFPLPQDLLQLWNAVADASSSKSNIDLKSLVTQFRQYMEQENLSLRDLCIGFYQLFVCNQKCNLQPKQLIYAIDALATAEWRATCETTIDLQLSALVCSLVLTKLQK